MAQQLPEILTDEEPDAPELRQLASVFSPDEVQLFYQIAIHGRNDMALAPDEYAGFTMALLRMLAFAPLEGKMLKSLPAAVTHKEEAPALPKTEPAKTELPAQPKSSVSRYSARKLLKLRRLLQNRFYPHRSWKAFPGITVLRQANPSSFLKVRSPQFPT